MVLFRIAYAPAYFLIFVGGAAMLVSSGAAPIWLVAMGPLTYLWAVAPVHRHHHLASETDGDVNFGLFLTVWDMILGTARFSSSGHIRAGQLGIAGHPDYPETYLAQLGEPFRSWPPQSDPVQDRHERLV